MALQVWLPLNGNLNNQGLADVTISSNGSTLINDGKIGKCYKNANCSITNLNGLKVFPMTICFWAKTDATTSWQKIVMIDDNNLSQIHGIYIADSARLKYEYSPSININDSATSEWHHYAFTINNGESIGYYDGIQKQVSTESITADVIGRLRIGTSGSVYLNDVRIYDHALSPREVAEIAKGLVLHYPLNRDGFGLDNMLIDTRRDAGASHTGYAIVDYNFSESVVNDITYTITAHVTTSSEKTFVGFYHSGGSYSMGGWQPITDNGYYKVTFTANSNMASQTSGSGHGFCRVYVSNNPSGTQGSYTMAGTAHVDWIKIEKGSVATPWVPNSADTDYSTFGLNSAVIPDTSGYGHNADIINSSTYTADTPRYQTAIHMTATNQKLHVSNLVTSGFGNTYSIAWWGKSNTYSGTMHWGFSDGIRLNGIYNGNLWNTGDGSNNPLYKPGTTTQVTAPTVNVWHHFVMVGDGSTCKVYMDGELWGQAKTYKAISGTSIYFNGWDSGTSYCQSDLNVSDFRIYATALSADQVKQLYEAPISLANNGTLFANEFNET